MEKYYYLEAIAKHNIILKNKIFYKGQTMPTKWTKTTLEKYEPYLDITKKQELAQESSVVQKVQSVKEVEEKPKAKPKAKTTTKPKAKVEPKEQEVDNEQLEE